MYYDKKIFTGKKYLINYSGLLTEGELIFQNSKIDAYMFKFICPIDNETVMIKNILRSDVKNKI